MLKKIKIKNFRGIQDIQINLDETTVLIGGNNTGKSTILDALQMCLSRSLTRKGGLFIEYDYHLKSEHSQPTEADPIEITLIFSENTPEEWDEEILQMLAGVVQIRDDDLQSIIFNVTSYYDDGANDFVTTWNFLDLNGNPLPKANNPRFLYNLQQITPAFYLSALRDAAQEFRPRSQFWGPFVRILKMETGLREEIENDLAALNQRVLDAHEAFAFVREHLRNTSRLVPLSGDDPVTIEPIPAKVFDMLSRTQVMLSGKTGARLPIGRHGEGTQSLAVICLFDAFLEAQLIEGYSSHTQPILALEEPEAHLHPSAIRAVGSLLCGLRGQKVITTHSGDLVASVPITALRRLRRSDGTITVHQVAPGILTAEEQRKLDHHIRLSRGNLLFARFWLLVEGETDSLIFQECARIIGFDLFCEGICCIEFSTIGLEKFIKLADQLGIDWFVVADKDSAGDDYVRTVQRLLNGRPQVEYVRQHPYDVIETFLCMEGYGVVYEANISPQKDSTVTATQGTPEYWKQVVKAQNDKGKPQVAAQVIDKIEVCGPTGVPHLIREVIERAQARAKEAE